MLKLNKSKICGISVGVPKEVSKNDLSAKEMTYIGVTKRYLDTAKNINTSDLCYQAAEKIVKKLKWKKNEIKYLIFVSQTRDFIFPSTACILQNKLKLNNNIIAFDIPLGCSGFIYGLMQAFMLSEKIEGKGLLLVGDMSSKFIDKNDRQNYVLFGDAGAAVAVDFTKNISETYFSFGTDGSGEHHIKYYSDQFKKVNKTKFVMKGASVFQYMIKKIPDEIEKILNISKTNKNDIDFFILHQASKFLINKISEKTNLDNKKVLLSLNTFGNTNSASIPVTIFNSKKNINNSKILMSGFGVGLSWGSALLDLKQLEFTELVKI